MGSVFYAIQLGDKILTFHDVLKITESTMSFYHTVLQQRKTK